MSRESLDFIKKRASYERSKFCRFIQFTFHFKKLILIVQASLALISFSNLKELILPNLYQQKLISIHEETRVNLVMELSVQTYDFIILSSFFNFYLPVIFPYSLSKLAIAQVHRHSFQKFFRTLLLVYLFVDITVLYLSNMVFISLFTKWSSLIKS